MLELYMNNSIDNLIQPSFTKGIFDMDIVTTGQQK